MIRRYVALAGLSLLPAALFAQEQTPPVQVSLEVRLPAGKSSYVMGELIPLELVYSGTGGPDYFINTASYDRSGRLGYEQYDIAPASGVVDPLDDYYRGGLMGFIGGGLSSFHPLDGTPFRLRVYLNEWVRFTAPGQYRLVVSTTHRLQRHGAGQLSQRIVSAPLQLTIERATDAWQADQLRVASEAAGNRNPEQAKSGMTILRHLGTEAAALAIVSSYQNLPNTLQFDAFAGLIGSPHRAAIVAAMEARIAAGMPLGGRFVEDLSTLRVFLEQPRDTGDPAARRARHRSLIADYQRRWSDAFMARGATPESMDVALERLVTGGDTGMMAAMAAFVAHRPSEAVTAFLALPAATQRTLVEFRWPEVRPWIRPALDRLYAASTPQTNSRDSMGSLALRRIVELDPVEGRRLALEEIATGDRGIAFDTLAMLPDATLPELDAPLRVRLETNRGDLATSAWLAWRYGSPALLPVVEGLFSRGWACSIEGGLLAYLLKHKPEVALARLAPSFDRRALGGCVVPPYGDIARRAWNPTLEKAVIALLDASDIQVIADAARNLGQYGSAAVKAPLMDRLTRWEAEWRGKASALDYRPGSDSPVQIENAITAALLDNRRITLGADDLARIRALCVTDGCRRNVDSRRR